MSTEEKIEEINNSEKQELNVEEKQEDTIIEQNNFEDVSITYENQPSIERQTSHEKIEDTASNDQENPQIKNYVVNEEVVNEDAKEVVNEDAKEVFNEDAKEIVNEDSKEVVNEHAKEVVKENKNSLFTRIYNWFFC
jgi:hypothetical protein